MQRWMHVPSQWRPRPWMHISCAIRWAVTHTERDRGLPPCPPHGTLKFNCPSPFPRPPPLESQRAVWIGLLEWFRVRKMSSHTSLYPMGLPTCCIHSCGDIAKLTYRWMHFTAACHQASWPLASMQHLGWRRAKPGTTYPHSHGSKPPRLDQRSFTILNPSLALPVPAGKWFSVPGALSWAVIPLCYPHTCFGVSSVGCD